jgi:hypothetical protein
MKHLKRYNEDVDPFGDEKWDDPENDPNEKLEVKVKHLIEYLQQFDPEKPVKLDRDDWVDNFTLYDNEIDIISNSGLFDPYSLNGDVLFINN